MRSLLITAVAAWAVCATSTSKRGLSEADGWSSFFCDDLSVALDAPQPVSWAYSWAINPAAPCPQLASGLANFVPMVWGQKDVNVTLNFTAGVRFLLGFNEPNGAKQSDLTPAEAAALWPSVAATAKAAGLGLVSPAPAGNGVAWLDSFFSLCNNCLDDVVAIAQHTYACTGPALQQVCAGDTNACMCVSQVRFCVSCAMQSLGLYTKYGKPIWVTEFNCGDGSRNASAAEHLAYMKTALPILEASVSVERYVGARVVDLKFIFLASYNSSPVRRYAWMSGRNTKVPGAALFAADAATELGRFYLGMP